MNIKSSNATKRLVVFIYDSIAGFISFPLALCLRFGHFDYKKFDLLSFWDIVFIAFACKLVFFLYYKLSRGIWKFSSTPDLILIVKATAYAGFLTLLMIFYWNHLVKVPRSVFIIDWFLINFFLGGGRFSYRIWKERRKAHSNKLNTLVIGAGNACEQLIREIKKDATVNIHVIGILDDDSSRHKRTIHGIPVLGGISDLENLSSKYSIENIVIAIPSASATVVRDLAQRALDLDLSVKTLPGVKDIVGGRVQISHLRSINVEDLLGRQPVILDSQAVEEMLSNKTILVTGAGGSIGSELCNQILKCSPDKIILFEICENFIYHTDMELREKFPNITIVPTVGDIRDRERVDEVILEYKPDIIFHTAAYKHVPMMELNAKESVKNNILGTKIMAQSAIDHNVPRFILISTDKAVNPTNVYGATKRAAEIICQILQNSQSQTQFITLRFGNVLASAGSVIPRFMKQIKNGGPVTVTHPEITRYFMSIPEATQLVLQACALGKGGEIFILDMGEPIKILDLAKNLIKLSGLIPDEDINIEFTGLRPAEKLYEELLADKESTLPTSHKMVRVAQARTPNDQDRELIDKLIKITKQIEIKDTLKKLVPEYEEN
jgi:FlaA1/EpsC-like NDP-sugar epimerase